MPRLPVNGVELNWDRYGDSSGTPLVLCHGYTGSSHDFALQIDPLSQTRDVIVLDQRGHGLSTKTHDAAGYTIDQLTDDLIQFIEQVSDKPVDLPGHSMGGRVSLGATLARPDLIRSLILMDTSGWSFLPQDKSVRTMLADFLNEFVPTARLSNAFKLGGPQDVLIEASTTAAWRQRNDELFAELDPFAVKALGTELLTKGMTSVRSRLGEVACPVTVIVGAHDHPLVDQAPELTAEVAHGQLCVIQGAYHSPQLTHPEQWRDAVVQHLAPLNA